MTVGRIPSVEGGIQPTLLTAKGDLISATAASTVARLAVGSNDQILVADSSTATGLKWATATATGESWTQVATGSTTSGSSLALTSLSGYSKYKLMFNAVTVASGPTSYTVRFNADSGANYDYDLVRQSASTSVAAGAFSANQSHADNIYFDTIANTSYLTVEIGGCTSTTGYKRFQNQLGTLSNTGAVANVFSTGIYKSNSTITSINVALASSSFAAGTYYLYGSN